MTFYLVNTFFSRRHITCTRISYLYMYMPVCIFLYIHIWNLFQLKNKNTFIVRHPTTNHARRMAGKGMMGPEKNDGPVEMEKTFLWETGLVRESLLKHALDSMIINASW